MALVDNDFGLRKKWERDDEWPVPSTTPTSTAVVRDLKRRGRSFVELTTVYAFM